MPITKIGEYTCEHCGAELLVKEQFVQEKDTEYVISCPSCKNSLGEFNTRRNRLFVIFERSRHP